MLSLLIAGIRPKLTKVRWSMMPAGHGNCAIKPSWLSISRMNVLIA
jgi:hypothetical protein